jgi:biotin operon repressor
MKNWSTKELNWLLDNNHRFSTKDLARKFNTTEQDVAKAIKRALGRTVDGKGKRRRYGH